MAVSGSQLTRIGASIAGVAKKLVITAKAEAALWNCIDTSQTLGCSSVDTSQTAGYSALNTSQTSGWTPITN